MRVISDRQLKSDNINHWGLIIDYIVMQRQSDIQ